MRHNENNGESVNGKIIFSNIDDSNPIFEVSCFVIDNLSAKAIKANYNLTIYGDVEAQSLSVMGNFVCLGSCRVENLSVQGDCYVRGDLEISEEGLIAGNLRSKELTLNSLEVRGNIFCDSIDFDDVLVCDGKCIVSEGIMGAGIVQCNLVLCGEYASNDDDAHVVIASEIENLIAVQGINNTKEETSIWNEIITKAQDTDWEEFEEYLVEKSEKESFFAQSLERYRKLLSFADYSKLVDLKQYIELVDLVFCQDEIIQKCNLKSALENHLLKKAGKYVNELTLPALTKTDFADLLHKVTNNRFNIQDDIYHFIVEQLYAKIGLKYSTVCIILGDDE